MNATCPTCGKPLPPAALGGLCPECLLKAGAAPPTQATGSAGPRAEDAGPPPPAAIASLFPHLEILEALGHGGMGAVYKARQPRLDRLVALKLLSADKQGDPQFAERFQREARTLALLQHPNIVTIHDFGEVQGRFYLLMEYVDGVTLRQLLQTRKLSPEEALAIVPRICEALQYAHKQGVVHRDVKPENILLDKQGQVKMADFGIAKIMGQPGSTGLTQAQQIIGTPSYMAPEQLERPQTVDHRADIFSLGVVFYEMLTGELPLGRFAPPSRKVDVDVRLDEVVLRALEKEPERRYQQAGQVKTDVETIASTPPSAPPPVNPRAASPGPGAPPPERPAGFPSPVPPPWPSAAVTARVTAPAIGLMVVGVLKLLSAIKLFLLLGGPLAAGLAFLGGLGIPGLHGLLPGLIAGAGLIAGGIKLVVAPLIFYGGVKMLRLQSYTWALVAAILAIVSISLVGLPVGIWALVILLRPEVRDAFPTHCGR